MKKGPFDKLLAFLERLDQAKIPYDLRHSRDDAIMVLAFAPGQYWEVDFLHDGEVEIERYRSNGRIEDETVLPELFALWSDDESSKEQSLKQDDAIART